ncbi:MAG: hypothetical protein H6621_09310 [Halobacteriovoraceae bacterium]|nr:hypothetical protein [Halobacteriovoraceae bacterium]MCB9095253.1 hypothetical protein [Halobacteriovoraceae bacterium]
MELNLGIFQFQDAKRIQAELKNQGIQVELQFNDQTCQSGCQVTVELWGFEIDKEAIVQFFQKENQRDLGGHQINNEQLSEVFDPQADSVVCQACGFKFNPSEKKCPDCGLVYG